MSLDRRLRAELDRDAETISPDVERNLAVVEFRARRQPIRVSSLLMIAVAVLALGLLLRFALPSPSAPGVVASPSPPPSPSAAPSYAAIAGTYLVTLDAANPTIAQNNLAGGWTMRLAADGEIFLSPPAGFGSGSGSLSGLAFMLVGDRFRSNIFFNDFCSSIGTYTWSLQGGRLSFAPVDDNCAIRRALLSTEPWQSSQ